MSCHLLLMEKNLSYQTLLKSVANFLKHLVHAEYFSFMQINQNTQDTYYLREDKSRETTDEELNKETMLIQPNKVLLLDECIFYPRLSDHFKIS